VSRNPSRRESTDRGDAMLFRTVEAVGTVTSNHV
jgi:hypothetical protein